MDSVDERISERKDKIKSWLKNRYNLTLFGIIALGILIRLYYFFITKSQPLWWDESDYLAFAKNLAGFNVEWIVTAQHNSLFPYLVAIFFKLGLSAEVAKFFLEFIPSVLLIFLVYSLTRLMFEDKRMALITTFLMATFWAILFNSMRFHLGVPALLFGLLSFYVFWQGYEKREKIFGKINPKWAIPLTAFLVVLTYSIRRAYFLFGFFFLVYMLFTRRFKDLIKDKYNWVALAVGVVSIFLAETFIFIGSIGADAANYFHGEVPINLFPFDVFKAFFQNIFNPTLSPLFWLFWFGLAVMGYKLFFYIGYFKKPESTKARAYLFAFLSIFIVLSYFLFFQRSATGFGEPRWYFPLLYGSLVAISAGVLVIGDALKKYSKYIAILVVVVLIGFGGYEQVKHADLIIDSRVGSYNGIRQAGLFLKDYSDPDDVIISIGEPQPAYYAERTVIRPAFPGVPHPSFLTFEQFMTQVEGNPEIKFIIVSFNEPGHPEWMRKDVYTQHPQTGQPVLAAWEIPFMDTTINFITGQQDIKQTLSYPEDSVTFNLVTIQEGNFVYEIIRDDQNLGALDSIVSIDEE